MNNSPVPISPKQRIFQFASLLNKHRALIILPAILGMVLAAVYAVALRSEVWSARQTLTLRDDLLGSAFKPGRFESLESMKSAQESIFEIARKPEVIRSTLEELGPESHGLFGLGGSGYPSDEVIESVQGAISFSAPNGAELGKTETIILNTKSSSRERSAKFIELLVDQIISKVNEVRVAKFQGMKRELSQNCIAAEKALEESNKELRKLDAVLGQDAAGMSSIGDSSFRDDPITREMAQLKLERRGVRTEVESAKNVRDGLIAAKSDPNAIVNISSEVANRQPELNLLKQELVKLKGEYAAISGRYEDEHPRMKYAVDSIISMQDQIRLQLDNAIKDVENQLGIKESRLARLDGDLQGLKDRLVILGANRADGLTLIAAVKKRGDILNTARSKLAQVEGLVSDQTSTLLTKTGGAQVSTRADGMGKKDLVLAGGLGGLLLGIGCVMLIAPPVAEPNGQETNFTPERSVAGPVPGGSDLGMGALSSSATNVLNDLVSGTTRRISETVSRVTAKGDKTEVQEGVATTAIEESKTTKSKTTEVKTTKAKELVKDQGDLKSEPKTFEAKPVVLTAKQTQPIPVAKVPAEITPPSAPSQEMVERIVAETYENVETTSPFKRSAVTNPLLPKALRGDDKNGLSDTATVEIPQMESSPFPVGSPASANASDSKVSTNAQRGFKIDRKGGTKKSTAIVADSPAADRASELEEMVRNLKASTDEVAGHQDKIEESLDSLSSMVEKQVDKATAVAEKRIEAPTIPLGAQMIPGNAMDQVFEEAGKSNSIEVSKVDNAAKQMETLKNALSSSGTGMPDAAALEGAASCDSKKAGRIPIQPRGASIRPAGIAKAAETKDAELASDTSSSARRSMLENPFLKDRPQKTEASEETTDSTASVPVPDQIKKLSESIASFAKPFRSNKAKDGKEKF